ncbi:alpha/beta fold hydrolase [Prescottella agglutinans]|uniref:Pimeloyl-ACP methyl ester carboxylesterase n=1 Tax=Prescottella agglutinans TaxID=1644129 RepID=A0ABT6MIA0_9NOCA|nr:alpha/beta hydrolase [Prescottella agglutinans]MDH6283960.1 pimeloyl-ACP methyl ester carboxylesterase [Prescottella agglutinans]
MKSTNRAGSGEPVLLLHGFTLSHHVWHNVVDNLSNDYDVLAMSMPGHWEGPRLRLRDVGVRGIADGIERELDKIGWETCHIAGNSLGGQVGFELERRGRARSLAPINPSGGWKRFSYTEFRVGLGFAAQFPLAAAARAFGDRMTTREIFQRPIVRNCSKDMTAVTLDDAANVLRAASHCPIYLPMLLAGLRDGPLKDQDIRRVTAPTTLMLSEFDNFVTRSECIQRLVNELPDHVEEVILPGVGHIPMLENPGLVADALRAHLVRVAHRRSGQAS